ncbi:hypothetical protein PPL_02570 [Heterostelium album PN500]|uniref:F-box domain-containing protein n=1 Tax=Heterostelium pallidum (strain ATCC 26659 / Pp 5 / PN500) TaxID=670386 RepID=D3B2F8_HETP5|nr:hypothetical protein PPL_02570 [Heterostelium album PN500]EFA83506.1 hypothetical protein PPL_02570 [Heterostelium album PN500]|eukprot:XP_020435623.1 hypothetical protein PPL_02570 [Heterostelium album PN500]
MAIDNNNNSYKIVHLSHLLLNNITRYLDNVDNIRFSFVCKRWYHERESYLFFTSDADVDYFNFYKEVQLKSFKSIKIHNNLKYKTLFIFNKKSHFDRYDKSPYNNNNRYIEFLEGSVTYNDIDQVHLKLSQGSMDILKFKDQLERLAVKKLALPPTIQRFTHVSLWKSGDLPSSLKYLSLDDYSSSLSVGSLPPQLEHLHIVTYRNVIELANDSVLPRTLTTIENCPSQWFKILRNLPLLTTLTSDCNIPFGYLEAGDLPQSLTRLELHKSTTKFKPGVIPSSIKYLFLNTLDLSSEVLPKDAHFDYLGFSDTTSPILPGQLPPNIIELEIFKYSKLLVPGSLPFGIVTLKFPCLDAKFLIEGVIPSSTKTLQLFNYNTLQHTPFDIASIPNSVEHLILGTDEVDVDLPNLPDSIKTLECRRHLLKKYNIESLKPSITTIKMIEVKAAYFYRIDPSYFIARTSSDFILIKSKASNNILLIALFSFDLIVPSMMQVIVDLYRSNLIRKHCWIIVKIISNNVSDSMEFGGDFESKVSSFGYIILHLKRFRSFVEEGMTPSMILWINEVE